MKTIHKVADLPKAPRGIYLYGAGLSGKYIYHMLCTERPDIIIKGFIDDRLLQTPLKLYQLGDVIGEDYIIVTTIHSDEIINKLNEANKLFFLLGNRLLHGHNINEILIEAHQYQMVINSFRQNIDGWENLKVTPEEVVSCVEQEYINDVFYQHIEELDLKALFSELSGLVCDDLYVFPSTGLFEKGMATFLKSFGSICVYDEYKTGVLQNICIQHPCQIDSLDTEKKCFFMPTTNRFLIEFLREKYLNKHPEIVILTLFDVATIFLNKAIDESRVFALLEKILCSTNPLIVFGGKYYNNFTPTFKALEHKGYNVFLVHQSQSISHAPSDPAYDRLPFSDKYTLNTNEMILFAQKLSKGSVIMQTEGFLNPMFDGKKTVSCYLYPLLFMTLFKVKKYLFLYDLIKPFYTGFEYEDDYMSIYNDLLVRADGLIFNSNTQEACDFIKNTFPYVKKSLFFPRYNYSHKKVRKNKLSGFHIAIIGTFLNEEGEGDEMRTIKPYIVEVLKQKIHLHYFFEDQEAFQFYDQLEDELKDYFHIHKTIFDQQELIEEISCYHSGWMIHNTQKMADMIANARTQKFKDLLFMFMLTTVPSAILAFGCAGLPMFINRSMQGLMKVFPEEFFIPIELSETLHIDKIIEKQDWKERHRYCDEHRGLFSVESNIEKIIGFMDE